jgi:hypothetical protein
MFDELAHPAHHRRHRDDDAELVSGGTVPSGRAGYRERLTADKRAPRGRLRYSHTEWTVIAIVAARHGMKPGAWAQRAAYEAAVRENGGQRVDHDRDLVAELLEEMRQHRRVLTNIGGNLNDLARVANSTGTIENETAARTVMRLIGDVVRASDALVRDVHARLLP